MDCDVMTSSSSLGAPLSTIDVDRPLPASFECVVCGKLASQVVPESWRQDGSGHFVCDECDSLRRAHFGASIDIQQASMKVQSKVGHSLLINFYLIRNKVNFFTDNISIVFRNWLILSYFSILRWFFDSLIICFLKWYYSIKYLTKCLNSLWRFINSN